MDEGVRRIDVGSGPDGWLTPAPVPLDAGGPPGAFPALPEGFTDTPVLAHLAAWAARRPDRMAVEDATLHLTYGDLLRAVAGLARGVVATTPPGACVAILLPNTALYPVAALACLAAGHPYLALDPHLPSAYNLGLMTAAAAATAVTQNLGVGHRTELPAGVRRLDVNLAFAEPGAHPWPDLPLPEVDVDAPALILFTSGSSGAPKGIVNAQRALLQRVRQQVEAVHAGPGDVFLPLAALATIAGTRETLSALLSGATLRVCDVRAAGLRAVRRQMREHRVGLIYAVPALLRDLVAAGDDPADFASLRVVRLGGDRVLWSDADLIARAMPGALLQVGYSSTETTGAQGFVPRGAPRRGLGVPVGRMLPGTAYRVLDAAGRPAAPGEPGELVIRGPHVALGHWEGGRVVPGPIAEGGDGTRILATGDRVSLSADGVLEHLGRIDRQVKLNGLRVEPAELEATLRRMPGVRDAAVTTVRAGDGVALVAFVAAGEAGGDGAGTAPEDAARAPARDIAREIARDLRTRLRAELPAALRPARLHVLPVLPRLPSHKLDAAALAAIDGAASPTTPPAPAGARADGRRADGGRADGAARAVVERCWRRVLGRVEPETPWDAAGGDSLQFMRLVGEIEAALGTRFAVGALRLDMTPAALAAALGAVPRQDPDPEADEPRTVFLCPGSVGDGPALVRLREEVGARVRWATLRYPDWRATPADARGVVEIGADIARQITLLQPAGAVHLAGYSFGGLVAAEAAALLGAQGRTVAFLGILDACIAPVREGPWVRVRRSAARFTGNLDSPLRLLVRAAVRGLVRAGRAGWLAAAAGRLSGALRFTVELEAAHVVRSLAYRDWTAIPGRPRLACRITLFRSQEARLGAPPDLGWSGVADAVTVVDVPGTHLGMIQPPHRSLTAARLGVEILSLGDHAAAVR